MMLNFEKYIDEIKAGMRVKEISCVLHNIRSGLDGCSSESSCDACRRDTFYWLLGEVAKVCNTCKHYREIKGEKTYFACLHEGQVIEEADDVPCEFWEA